MAGPHTDRIVKELSVDARNVLARLKDEELAAGGFIHDAEVNVVMGFLVPRVERIVGGLVGCAVERYGKMTLDDLLEMFNGVKQEHETP